MYRIVECGLRVLSVRQGYVQNCRVWTESAESLDIIGNKLNSDYCATLYSNH